MVKNDRILEVRDLTKFYTSGYVFTKRICGAEDVSFSLEEGEILTLVGESGSGKSTVANMILRLITPTDGEILFNGESVFNIPKKQYWRNVQGIFQDPYSSFNKYYVVDKALEDSFDLLEKTGDEKYSTSEREDIMRNTLYTIGMNPDEILGRYPHQISGGQMQRLLIARSLIVDPDVLIADETTSMIDASTRVSILNELKRLKAEGMSVIFITHDVAQACYLADRASIMKNGKIVERGSVEEVFFEPEHPYTKELISSVPPLHEKWDIASEKILE